MHIFAGIPIYNTAIGIMLVLTACGCFIVGVNLMSRGFVHASLRANSFFIRGFNCPNRFAGVGAGIAHTALAQSSDVTSVTLVRLADVGVITLSQACACIIGANIGTTVTTFIVSLSAFDLTPYFAFCAFIGAIPLLSKKKGVHIFGEVVAGFGVLFIGIQLLGANIENEAFRELVKNLFTLTESPILLIAVAMGTTMIVQSSSVVTSLVVFLVSDSLLPFGSALCLVAGANIGTCVTSWLAAGGASVSARRVALFHTIFNMVGAALFLAVMYSPLKTPFLNAVGALPISNEFKVALFHLTFNLCAAAVMIPLLRPSVWISKKIIKH